MAGRFRSLSLIVLAQLLAEVACGPGTEPSAVGMSDTTGLADTTDSGATTGALDDAQAESSSTGDIGEVESSGTTTDAATTASESTGAPACDPVVPGAFNPCWDAAAGQTHTRECGWMGTSESVGFPGCLLSATVEDASVCILSGCEDRCDCFAQPTTGTARVECMEGVIADDTACVLWCADGQQCPDGMVCGFNVCFWEP